MDFNQFVFPTSHLSKLYPDFSQPYEQVPDQSFSHDNFELDDEDE